MLSKDFKELFFVGSECLPTDHKILTRQHFDFIIKDWAQIQNAVLLI